MNSEKCSQKCLFFLFCPDYTISPTLAVERDNNICDNIVRDILQHQQIFSRCITFLGTSLVHWSVYSFISFYCVVCNFMFNLSILMLICFIFDTQSCSHVNPENCSLLGNPRE